MGGKALRDAQETIEKLENIVQHDRKFFGEMAQAEAEKERKEDIEECARLATDILPVLTSAKERLPTTQGQLISLGVVERVVEMFSEAAASIDLDGERDIEEALDVDALNELAFDVELLVNNLKVKCEGAEHSHSHAQSLNRLHAPHPIEAVVRVVMWSPVRCRGGG